MHQFYKILMLQINSANKFSLLPQIIREKGTNLKLNTYREFVSNKLSTN